MNRTLRIVATAVVAAAFVVAVGGCGSKSSNSSSSSSSNGSSTSGGGSIKTGPGITAKTITLGVLTDLSGVFAPFGNPLTKAHQLYWKQQNANGGVCNRTV